MGVGLGIADRFSLPLSIYEVKILPYAEAPEKALKAPISPQIVRLMTIVNY